MRRQAGWVLILHITIINSDITYEGVGSRSASLWGPETPKNPWWKLKNNLKFILIYTFGLLEEVLASVLSVYGCSVVLLSQIAKFEKSFGECRLFLAELSRFFFYFSLFSLFSRQWRIFRKIVLNFTNIFWGRPCSSHYFSFSLEAGWDFFKKSKSGVENDGKFRFWGPGRRCRGHSGILSCWDVLAHTLRTVSFWPSSFFQKLLIPLSYIDFEKIFDSWKTSRGGPENRLQLNVAYTANKLLVKSRTLQLASKLKNPKIHCRLKKSKPRPFAVGLKFLSLQ